MIFTGDSGAGKTTATQQLIDYFTKFKVIGSNGSVNGATALERKV